jgi:hypothetical protein
MKLKHPIPVVIALMVNIALWVWIFADTSADSVWRDFSFRRNLTSVVFFLSMSISCLCIDFGPGEERNARIGAIVCFALALMYAAFFFMHNTDALVSSMPNNAIDINTDPVIPPKDLIP